MTESFVQWNICDEMVAQVQCHTNATVMPEPSVCDTPGIALPDCLNEWCSDKSNNFDLQFRFGAKDFLIKLFYLRRIVLMGLMLTLMDIEIL